MTRAERDSDKAGRVEAKKAHLLAKASKFRATRRYKAIKGLPQSGSEEEFTQAVYGSARGKASNNCYAFAVDMYEDGGHKKLQPGELSGNVESTDDLTQCPKLNERALQDLRSKTDGGYVVDPNVPCRSGYYKIMGMVDPGQDFHWCRQMGDIVIPAPGGKSVARLARDMGVDASQIFAPNDPPAEGELIAVRHSGLWAHKRGLDELEFTDSDGNYIVDPRKAKWKWGDLNYTQFCGAFCVSSDFGKGQ